MILKDPPKHFQTGVHIFLLTSNSEYCGSKVFTHSKISVLRAYAGFDIKILQNKLHLGADRLEELSRSSGDPGSILPPGAVWSLHLLPITS